MKVAIGRRLHGYMAAGLLAWAGWCLLTVPAPAATGPTHAAESASHLAGRFDRAVLQQELSRPMAVLQEQPADPLRTYVQRLADLQFAMELAVDVSPAERDILTQRILTRIGQVGLLIRQRAAGRPILGKAKALPNGEPGPPSPDDLFTVIVQNSGLLVRLLGGLLIAYALGGLVTHRRIWKPAAPVDPPESEVRPPAQEEVKGPMAVAEDQPVSLVEIRWALAAGRIVKLQMGYEIAPSERDRFLTLIREMQRVLRGVKGQTYTVWEDPAHPNRFYEQLECRDVGVLDHLAAADGPLPRLVEQVEACRAPGGFAFRRVWWDAVPEHQRGMPFAPGEVASTTR